MDFILKEQGWGMGSEYYTGLRAQPQTHSLPVRAQPLFSVQHVVDAAAIALQQILPALLPSPWALAGGEGQILPAAFLALQHPVRQKGKELKFCASPGLWSHTLCNVRGDQTSGLACVRLHRGPSQWEEAFHHPSQAVLTSG